MATVSVRFILSVSDDIAKQAEVLKKEVLKKERLRQKTAKPLKSSLPY